MRMLDPKTALKEGYERYFGPCTNQESWMLDPAMADARQAGQDVVCVVAVSQRQKFYWVYRRRFDAKQKKESCNQSN